MKIVISIALISGLVLAAVTFVSAQRLIPITKDQGENEEIKPIGPGYGYNDDYVWFDTSGDFVELKDHPQPFVTYPSMR